MKKVLAMVLGILVSSGASLFGQESTQPRAKLVRNAFKGGDFQYVAQEAALDLKEFANGPNDRVAVRICTKDPLPLALSTSAISPFLMLSYLDHYGFSRERVLFLRSEDCISDDPTIVATEFWAIPKGATPPPSSESIKSCQAQFELIGTESPIKSEHVYRAALQKLEAKLNVKSKAVGVIIGYYYKNPSPIMKQKLHEAQKILGQGRLLQGRYFISLRRWPGEYDKDSPEPEPKYPEVELIEISRDCNQI